MGQYIHIIHIVIPAIDKDAANAVAATVDPDFGGDQTFSDPAFSVDGTAPGTHIIVATAATETMRQEMLSALADWHNAGLSAQPRFWRMNVDTETLKESNVTVAANQPWSFDATLQAAGLQRVVQEEPQDEE